MSGDPEAPLSESSRAGHPRQNVPAASPPALPSAEERRERNAAVKFAGTPPNATRSWGRRGPATEGSTVDRLIEEFGFPVPVPPALENGSTADGN